METTNGRNGMGRSFLWIILHCPRSSAKYGDVFEIDRLFTAGGFHDLDPFFW